MTGPAGLSYEPYAEGEWLTQIRPANGAVSASILFLPPLFEEMNRTRAPLLAIMRRLAQRGHECLMPDLPGTGESERTLEGVSWDDWRKAAGGFGAGIVASLRGGCLLDDAVPAKGYWRLAPATGASLRRDLERAGLAGGAAAAGYPASEELLDRLKAAEPASVAPLRVVRLASDPAEADAKIDGPALWRRSEPGTSDMLVQLAADDLASWAKQCAGS